ncbi:phospholipase d p1 [Ophiostoma piceae UAMH 11346]|uniref:Phospholipase n=1 Tax=Ophiostoma piceae (strain UAMH 11346) TaxID=1262450 RepID=S3CD71_OPHP1|nr:phospholipase d p1 [Ophiostoma piceae UAMH 11346]
MAGDGKDKSSLSDKFKNPFRDMKEALEDKLENSTPLRDAKIHLSHKKHQIGKLGNLFNSQHRHDEEHEKLCDEKRTKACESHRYESYFPERDGNLTKWYVDGRDYFWAVSESLNNAKETIYIADWWLSPELFMRRPPYYNQEWRLDQILKRRAEAGVKIYLIVYREVEAALACNSAHTKHALQALCPEGTPGYGNIRIMRHPDHNFLENAADMTFYWAHHEKFIVIDYNIAYFGGLDMCFGRWDDHTHALADVHPEGVINETWPGQDFNNNRVMDFQNVKDWKENELSKAVNGRMPWHDVSMGIIGPCVYDIAEHFVLRWNFIKRDKYKRDDRFDWMQLRGREGEDEDLVGVQRPSHPVGDYILHPLKPLEEIPELQPNQGTVHAQVVRSACDWSNGTLTEHSIQNAYSDIIRKAEHYVYIENQFFITATGDQQSPVHNTIGAAIVDAVVSNSERGKKNFKVIILIPAVPGFAGDLRGDAAMGTRAIMDYQYKSICRGPESIYEKIRARGVDPTKHIFFFNLRSYDRLAKTPAIKKMEAESGVSYKELARAEAEEIMGEGIYGTVDTEGGRDKHMGHASQQKNAEEESDFKRDSAKPDYLEHATDVKRRFEASRNNSSITQRTGADGEPGAGAVDADNKVKPVVAGHAMAGQGSLADEYWEGEPNDEVQNWIQEELYIHAKLLIADDKYVVCGSSNLNDRSQLGTHDSELSLVMQDTRILKSTMDGEPFEAGHHAATLRRYLWREHLGLLPPQTVDAAGDPNAQPPSPDSPNDVWDKDESWNIVEDPLSEELWTQWTEQASTNTEIFRHLFHADPDDHVKTFADYDRFMPSKGIAPGHIFDQFMPAEDVRAKLDKVRGHLVWMPLDFLKDSPMAETGLQVNQFTESVYA